jgi:hypothetical protein
MNFSILKKIFIWVLIHLGQGGEVMAMWCLKNTYLTNIA